MSIAILTQVYDEMRRLAIAGSATASGDFRLKKLVAPLEQAGAKAPVFGKVADAVKAVVDGNEKSAPQTLLDLTTLVNAILFTQGETGAAGKLEDIETCDLGAPTAQASARVLKPLLEALTSTGSGRLELIRDAHERGAFRDLRLVKPALQAIDDGYPEIADLVAHKVLPLYGKAIVPDLRAKLDLKGRAGHPRRLTLLHTIDPAGTRDLVKEALDSGSKEVKVAAIECLGGEPDDLSYLLEQAGAKAQDVRRAAYQALATMDDDEAVAVLEKAMNGKDIDLAAPSLHKSRNAKALKNLIGAIEADLGAVRKLKDKKEIGQKVARAITLLNCLAGRDDKNSESLVLKVFADRDELAKVKGEAASGSDLNLAVVRILANGTKKMRTTLVDTHASLAPEFLLPCFHAARRALPADKVYEQFVPYLTASVNEKKKSDPALARRDAIVEGLESRHSYYVYWDDRDGDVPPLDPRWLDAAVQLARLDLVRALIRPGHAGANAFLKKTFDESFKKAKQLQDCHEVVHTMIQARHPDSVDAFLAVLEKFGKKTDYYFGYWFGRLIPDLPRSALPRLEVLIPTLDERIADSLMGYMQELRAKET